MKLGAVDSPAAGKDHNGSSACRRLPCTAPHILHQMGEEVSAGKDSPARCSLEWRMCHATPLCVRGLHPCRPPGSDSRAPRHPPPMADPAALPASQLCPPARAGAAIRPFSNTFCVAEYFHGPLTHWQTWIQSFVRQPKTVTSMKVRSDRALMMLGAHISQASIPVLYHLPLQAASFCSPHQDRHGPT